MEHENTLLKAGYNALRRLRVTAIRKPFLVEVVGRSLIKRFRREEIYRSRQSKFILESLCFVGIREAIRRVVKIIDRQRD